MTHIINRKNCSIDELNNQIIICKHYVFFWRLLILMNGIYVSTRLLQINEYIESKYKLINQDGLLILINHRERFACFSFVIFYIRKVYSRMNDDCFSVELGKVAVTNCYVWKRNNIPEIDASNSRLQLSIRM